MSDEDARFEPGAVVDERYELIERLDGVGLGETWRARDPNIPTRVFTLKPLCAADGDEVEAAAPVEEKPVAKVGGAPPRFFEEAPRAPVLAQDMPPLPPPEEPTEDIGQFLAQTPAENPWGTEIMRRKVVGEPPRAATGAPVPTAPPPTRAPETTPSRSDNPWATEVLRRRALVPELAAAAMPPNELWGGTEVISRSSSFSASVSEATRREEQLSPVSGTLVGAPAFLLDEQVTTIERRKPSSAAPMASAPAERAREQAPSTRGEAPSGTLNAQATTPTRREDAAPRRGGSRVVIAAGAAVAFVAGAAVVVVLMGVLGVLPTAR